MKMTVGARRKDGKYPVKFVFPISGKSINKVLTKDQIDQDIAKAENAGNPYIVVGYRASNDRPRAGIEENADGDALIVTCMKGDASGTSEKVFSALKAAGLKPDDARPGWYKFLLGTASVSDGRQVLRDALLTNGIDVR